ncbi:unnamed protein product, partial [Symbiodinium natans]
MVEITPPLAHMCDRFSPVSSLGACLSTSGFLLPAALSFRQCGEHAPASQPATHLRSHRVGCSLLPFAAQVAQRRRHWRSNLRRLRQARAQGREGSQADGLQAAGAFGITDITVRQEIEERLGALRGKMDAIRQGDEGAIQRSHRNGSELHGSVFWCDSDPDVAAGADVLRGSGLALQTFTEPEALLQAYDAYPQDVLCIMSSMMEGNGRKERGAMNALGLFASIRRRVEVSEGLKQPLLAVISCSADEAAARAAGAEIVVFGSRIKAQNLATRTSLDTLEQDVAGLKTMLAATPASQDSVEELKVVVQGFEDRLQSLASRDEGPPPDCEHCGNTFAPDSNFCRQCGKPRRGSKESSPEGLQRLQAQVTDLSERLNALVAAQIKRSGGQREEIQDEFVSLAATLQKACSFCFESARRTSTVTLGQAADGPNDWARHLSSAVAASGGAGTVSRSLKLAVARPRSLPPWHIKLRHAESKWQMQYAALCMCGWSICGWKQAMRDLYYEAQPWNEEDDNPWEDVPVSDSMHHRIDQGTSTTEASPSTAHPASDEDWQELNSSSVTLLCPSQAPVDQSLGDANAGLATVPSEDAGALVDADASPCQDQGTSMTPVLAERAVADATVPLRTSPSTHSAAVQATMDFAGEIPDGLPKEFCAEVDLATRDRHAQTEPAGPRKASKTQRDQEPRMQRTQRAKGMSTMPEVSNVAHRRQTNRSAMKDNGLPTVLKDLAQTFSARRHSKEGHHKDASQKESVQKDAAQKEGIKDAHKEGAQSRHQNPRPQGPGRVASVDAKDRPLSVFAKRQAGQLTKEEEPAKPKSADPSSRKSADTPSREERSPDRRSGRPSRQDHASSAPAQRGRQSTSPKETAARRSRSDADKNRDKDMKDMPEVDLFQIPEQLREARRRTSELEAQLAELRQRLQQQEHRVL